MPVTRFVAPGPGGAHAHADPPGDASVAVGSVSAALLVADEHVAQLGIVAEHVVQRQDHAARVAEEHVDALAEERLAEDVGADARAAQVACFVEHGLAGVLDRGRRGGPVVRDVAAPGCVVRTRPCLRVSLRDRHPSALRCRSCVGARQTKDPRLPARVLG